MRSRPCQPTTQTPVSRGDKCCAAWLRQDWWPRAPPLPCSVPSQSSNRCNSRKPAARNSRLDAWPDAHRPRVALPLASDRGLIAPTARSVRGETISFHVSTNPASRFTIDIYRTGYYGGDGGRLVKQLGDLKGRVQPDPPIGPKRLRNCEWPACAELKIPDDWLSGVYLGKLTALESGWQSYVIFILRDDRRADYIFQCSDNTWQSYNRWPNQFSLVRRRRKRMVLGRRRAGQLPSALRKILPDLRRAAVASARASGCSGSFRLAYWMESLGFDVTYISNLDTHRDPAGLRRARGFLSVGHDEYWTIEMFQNVRAAISAGVNVAFLSGNAVCGRIQFDDKLPAFERVGVFGPPGGMREFEQHEFA